MKGKIKFINQVAMIETATDEELRNVVITCDGAGEKQKNLVLDEMLKRARKEGYEHGFDDGYPDKDIL
jgi:ribosomal silencing factor RsfS